MSSPILGYFSKEYTVVRASVATISLILLAACSSTGGQNGTGQGGSLASGGAAGTSGGGANSGGAIGSSGGGASVSGSGGASGARGADGSAGGVSGAGGAIRIDASTGPAGGGGSSAGIGGLSGAPDAGTGSPVVTGLAFPEAEGFGQHASGGRDGTVYHVTNLNDSGAGSFRDAVSASNRIVVFDVGGYIQLVTAVSVKSNITIAGQTAPGGGIGFRGGEISFANSSNIIARYIRVRPGDETASTTDDALSLFRAKNAIVDHSSFEFAPWNNIDGVSDDWQNFPVTDITFQDCLIANPTGQQFGAHTESVASQWSWYRNIFANSHNRNPLAKINTVFVNNVLYNDSAGYTTHTSTLFRHDIVNNYFILGPASTGTDNTWYQVDKNQSIYYSGNLKDNNLNGALDGAATTPFWYQGPGTILTAPWSAATNAGTVHDPRSAYRIAVSLAGPLPRDPIDALVISQLRTLGTGTTGTGANATGPAGGLYTSQTQTGLSDNGYGAIASGTKEIDTDNDGMPDFWERTSGTNPVVNDAMKKAPDGYAQIEHYLNWLAEPRGITKQNTDVDVDLSSYTTGFSDVAPSIALSQPVRGSVQLLADRRTARFTPATGLFGLGSFDFKVSGSDGTTYSARVTIAVQP